MSLPLDADLVGVGRNDLGRAAERPNLAGHTEVFVTVFFFWHPELCAVAAPDDNRKLLIRIGLVEVQERGLTPRGGGVTWRYHPPADSCRLADMLFGLRRCDGF